MCPGYKRHQHHHYHSPHFHHLRHLHLILTPTSPRPHTTIPSTPTTLFFSFQLFLSLHVLFFLFFPTSLFGSDFFSTQLSSSGINRTLIPKLPSGTHNAVQPCSQFDSQVQTLLDLLLCHVQFTAPALYGGKLLKLQLLCLSSADGINRDGNRYIVSS